MTTLAPVRHKSFIILSVFTLSMSSTDVYSPATTFQLLSQAICHFCNEELRHGQSISIALRGRLRRCSLLQMRRLSNERIIRIAIKPSNIQLPHLHTLDHTQLHSSTHKHNKPSEGRLTFTPSKSGAPSPSIHSRGSCHTLLPHPPQNRCRSCFFPNW